MKICDCTFTDLAERPEKVPTVVRWIRETWPDARTDAAIAERIWGQGEPGKLPCTLLAESNGESIGFVSLVLFQKGISQGRPHWIDALYVEPEYRRFGLALRLIERAEQRARELGLERLFALTDIPGLYLKAGWNQIEGAANGTDSIVTREL